MQPIVTVFAGPNGAGKSTLFASLTSGGYLLGHFVNADVIAASLPAGASHRDYRAAKLAVAESQAEIAAPGSFAQETTLSGSYALRIMAQAKAAGLRINLLYIGVTNLEVSRERVATRVARGGHDIPLADQQRRFDRSRANIPPAVRLANSALLFDNSALEQPYRLVAQFEDQTLHCLDPLAPGWSRAVAAKLGEAP